MLRNPRGKDTSQDDTSVVIDTITIPRRVILRLGGRLSSSVEPIIPFRTSPQGLCTCFDASETFCFQCDEQTVGPE